MVTLKPFRPQKNAVSYGQEINRARATLKGILESGKNKQLVKYIKSVAELRIKGERCFEEEIKKYSIGAKNKRIRDETIRKINLYLYRSSKETALEIKETCAKILENKYNRR
ncbi:MAG: hypothetical protein WC320_00505 [Candidatus Paceibacterota bacterium]